ncbi:MAG: hypothetical protein RQ756_07030 [Flavobacteriaceae bacterium]|nr:hypothetical protein [Flavobacteriaceae bacterium]
MNYKSILSLFTVLLFSTILNAQVGINTTNPNAALDVESADQGVLFPRVALTAKNNPAPVINPNGGNIADGTIVYNTNTNGIDIFKVYPGLYRWSAPNSIWIPIDRTRVFLTDRVAIPANGTTNLALTVPEHNEIDAATVNIVNAQLLNPALGNNLPNIAIRFVESRNGEIRFSVSNLNNNNGAAYELQFVVVSTKN